MYLCREFNDSNRLVALKLYKEEYLNESEAALAMAVKEIELLKKLKHQNITQMLGCGADGVIVKTSGREIANLVYIIFEYVEGGDFYKMCQDLGALGEKGARYFID